MTKFKIRDKTIDNESKPYIIAEIGINHDGSFEKAIELVKAAASTGVDAVKFQTFKTSKLLSRNSDYFEMLKNYQLEDEHYLELHSLSQSLGIDAFSACFDEESAALWNSFNVSSFKIASGDITHHSLLQTIAKFGKPMIVSTGASSYQEIQAALEAIYTAEPDIDVALLHCVSKYPTSIAASNLKCIEMLRKQFNLVIGFSDHTIGTLASQVATGLGAKIIEKHFTLDKNLEGPDHKLSADPNEMSKLVKNCNLAFESIGNGKRELIEGIETQTAIRRSITVSKPVSSGTLIDRSMIEILRPGTGLPSYRMPDIVGHKALKDLEPGYVIKEEDVD